jgi:hypothetical protein
MQQLISISFAYCLWLVFPFSHVWQHRFGHVTSHQSSPVLDVIVCDRFFGTTGCHCSVWSILKTVISGGHVAASARQIPPIIGRFIFTTVIWRFYSWTPVRAPRTWLYSYSGGRKLWRRDVWIRDRCFRWQTMGLTEDKRF